MAIETFMEHKGDNGGIIRLGIDENNKLYINESEVVTTQKIVLNGWVNLSIIAGGVGTMGMFLIEMYKLFKC